MTPDPTDLAPRDRILLTAHDLFYRDGVRATGIDKVIAQAKVTKVTFYRNFPSKNDLICAYLDYRHTRWMSWFVDALARHRALKEQGLLVLVPVLEEWFRNPAYRGCAFINGVAELGVSVPGVIEISARHKQDMQQAIASLLPPESPKREALANAAALAVDGAIFKAQLEAQNASAEFQSLNALALLLQALEATS